MKFPTKGSLDDSSFIEILKDAANVGFTGMIRVENGPIVKVVYFQKGTISFASSNEKSDRLTEVLKKAGKLTSEQIQDAQSRLKPNVSLGKTLVELGYLSAKDLLWGARSQVDGILHNLLFWTQGEYQVQEGTLPREIIHLNLPVTLVIFEGIMKTQNREWLLQRIGSPESIYAVGSDFEQQNQTWKLPVSNAVSILNGRLTLHEIAEMSGMDTFELCKTVVALECLGIARQIHDEPMEIATVSFEEEQPFDLALEDPPELAVLSEGPVPGDVFPSPAPEDVQNVSPIQEQTVSEPDQPTLPTALPTEMEVQAPSEVPDSEIISKEPSAIVAEAEPEIRSVEDSNLPLEEDIVEDFGGEPVGSQTPFNWKALTTILLVAAAGILGAFYYRQRTTSVPAEPALPTVEQNEPKVVHPEPPAVTPAEPSVTQSVPTVAPEVTLDTPLLLFRSGRLADAAKSWNEKLTKNRSGYSIQIMIACQQQTVMDTYQLLNYSQEIIVLPVGFRGQNCYRVLFGQYSTRDLAQSAIKNLPPIFIQQNSPASVVALSRVLS